MPYLCHVNLLTLIMFNKSNKKETMKHKSIIPKDEYQSYKNDFNKEILNETNKKRTVETINIKIPTSEILITFALMYSNLTNQGKKEAQEQLKLIGENYDKLIDLNNNL